MVEIKAHQAEAESYYRQVQTKLAAQIVNLPLTPKRQQFEALKQRNREQYGYFVE